MKRLVALLVLALAMTAGTTLADAAVLRVSPHNLHFGKQAFDTFVTKSVEITNTSDAPVIVRIETDRVPDDFSPGQSESTCGLFDTLLPAESSCTHVVGFFPLRFFSQPEFATVRITALDQATGAVLQTQRLRMDGKGVEPSETSAA